MFVLFSIGLEMTRVVSLDIGNYGSLLRHEGF